MSSRPVTIFPTGAGTATCESYGRVPNENRLYRFTNYRLSASANSGYVFDSFRYVTTTVPSSGAQINGNAATSKNPFPSKQDFVDPVYPCEATGKGDGTGYKSWGSSGYIAVFKRAGSSSPDISLRTISVSATEGGAATGGGDFYDLSLCTITATPYSGRAFLYWTDSSGQIVSRDAIYAFIVTKSETFTAHFTNGPDGRPLYDDATGRLICADSGGELIYHDRVIELASSST